MPGRPPHPNKMAKRKRTRGAMGSAGKRRKNSRAIVPFKRRQARSKAMTTRSEYPVNVKLPRLTAKKRREYRRQLWNFSSIQTKFRSIFTSSSVITTPLSTLQQTITVAQLLSETTPFWTAAGGNQSVRFGVAAGSANPDSVIIRGGVHEVTVTNIPAGDNIRVRYQFIMPKQQLRNVTDTANTAPANDWLVAIPPTTTAIGSTIQDLPDYNEYFYPPYLDKEVIIRPGEAVKEIRKIRLRKVDADAFARGITGFPYLILYMNGTTDALADTARLTITHNLTYTIPDI